MSEPHILLVEDEPEQRRLVAEILRESGYRVTEAGSAEAALDEMEKTPFELVLADWKLPERDGLELLETIRSNAAETGFIMVTAYGTISHAVKAVQLGADDYLAKPFERQALLMAVERTLRSRRLADENRRLNEALSERDRLVDLVGSSPSMQKVYRQVEKLATTDATVLLTGESGTGKELAARALHALSGRSRGPFVAVNCSAIPEGLLEAEFFGAEKGAFTGADRSRAGRFEAADGGTLLLDEIGELPISLQPKLLRVLQDQKITRVGGRNERQVDARIIAATNRDLDAEVQAGRFRQDLFYRLNVVPIGLPPLRERRDDIPQLVQHFVERSARRYGASLDRFPQGVMKRLLDYAWPGNVRELANAVERLVLLSDDGSVRSEDLPDALAARPTSDGGFQLPPAGISWERHEQSVLRQALESTDGNRAQAARLLHLGYKAFLYRLEKHGLD